MAPVAAADDWIEVKSAHFTVVSNASERTTRRLVWQFEQVRSATAALFSWAKTDLNRPLSIIVIKDENSMRALAPEYWEERRSVSPASVWTGGPDAPISPCARTSRSKIAGRSIPTRTAYWSYIDMVLGQSIGRDLPLWFRRGFTEVLSNTIVRDDHVLFGAPIPSELQILRERQLLLLPKLLTITRQSPEEKEAASARSSMPSVGRSCTSSCLVTRACAGRSSPSCQPRGRRQGSRGVLRRDARSHRAAAERLPALLSAQHLRFRRINLDVSVEREHFPVRKLPAAESASIRAMFHAAMRRPVEARAAIAEARKADPNAAGTYVAEGLLADRDNKV